MRKKTFLFVVAILLTATVCAENYTPAQIDEIALLVFGDGTPRQVKGLSANEKAASIKVDTLYFNNRPDAILCQNGIEWVIIANESTVPAVVCQGKGEISVGSLQASPLWWLLSDSMEGLENFRHSNSKLEYSRGELKSVTSPSIYPPLLDKDGENKWNQSRNNGNNTNHNNIYNKYCPPSSGSNASDGRFVAGCTAVAMGQVMWYHKYPAQAEIPRNMTNSGITSGGTETHYYAWDIMPPAIYDYTSNAKVNEIACLLRDCGFAGHMQYMNAGSAMSLTYAKSALENTFHYSTRMKQYSSGASIFNYIIRSEIALDRPVIIQATHKSNGGTHTYVIDGYDEALNAYHINMGWGGYCSAWYGVAADTAYGNYTIARRMLYEIMPDDSEYEYTPGEHHYLSFRYSNNTIEVSTSGFAEIQYWRIVYISTGTTVKTGSSVPVNVSSLSSGLYALMVQTTHGTETFLFRK